MRRRESICRAVCIMMVFSIVFYSYACAQPRDKKVDDMMQEAVRLRQNGQVDASMQLAKEIMALNPSSAWPHTFISETYQQQSNLQAALQSSDRAVEVEPKNAFALRTQAGILVEMGQHDEARIAYLKAIEASDPASADYAFACAGLANVYLQQGEKSKAKPYIEKALAFEPKNTFFQSLLARAQ